MPLEWIERYDVRSDPNHEGWAVIVIDSRGFLGIVSDYGNFAYHWDSFGDDFRRFLAGLDWHYLHRKLMHGRDGRVYDGRATLEAIKKLIIEYRRAGELTREQARDEWTLALDSGIDEHRSDGFSLWYRDTQLENVSELYQTMPEPQCQAFCQKVWPRFIELLKNRRCVPIVADGEVIR